jgi:uncharacterized protein
VRIDTVLLKVSSRCNLDCSYCYIYHMGDESWRSLPKRLAVDVQEVIVEQLGALMCAQGEPFSVVLHGGEPLLLGVARLAGLFAGLRRELGSACSISIQTNGVLISSSILDLCSEQGITLSVSLDGPPEVHDRWRIDLRGGPSHAQVIASLERLKAHADSARLFSGVLAVVDPATEPAEIYRYFKSLGVPSVDFLYRDGNHTVLPYGKSLVGSDEYGRWMCGILDCYVADRSPFRIRLLDDMMRLLLGGAGVKEGVGVTDYGILVIDTDGSIKKNDTLKSSPLGDSFGETWSVQSESLADVAASPTFEAYHHAQRPTAAACQACPHLTVCGGGMVTHRYKDGSGYDNPTVFCIDQQRLIARMKAHLAAFHRKLAA